jgi:hypothetical protein
MLGQMQEIWRGIEGRASFQLWLVRIVRDVLCVMCYVRCAMCDVFCAMVLVCISIVVSYI